GVIAGLSSYYTKITISAGGASFVANTVTGNSFTVDAEGANAVLGNVKDVSLLSGTLADLSSVTTVRTKAGSVAAQGDAEINVAFDSSSSVITFSELEDSEAFDFGGNAYTYKTVGIVKDNNKLYHDENLSGSVTNTTLTGSEYRTMVASDGATLKLQNKTDDVIFVNSADTAVSAVYATQDYSSKNYTFDTLISGVDAIDATALDSGHSITANFATQVLTPSTSKFTVNEKTYNAVTALTIDATTTPSLSSSLNTGTVSLSKNDAVAMTGITDSISVDSGDGISVTAENEAYTLSGLNKNDVFTIGGYSYTMKSANMIVRNDGTNTELYTSTIAGGSLAQDNIEESSNWASYVQLESNGNLNLTTAMSGGVVVSNDFTEMYANLTVNGNTFDLDDLSGAETSDITAINLTATDSTLTTDFNATVKTATGSNTYNVNGNSYTAKNSALEIAAKTGNTSTITKGTITLEDSTVTTSSDYTISGSVSSIDIGSMKFTPAIGNVFDVNDDSYTRKALGLIKNDSYLWTREGDTTFALPTTDDSYWSNMKTLTADGVLNLKNGGISTGNTVILDYDVTKRIANLNYSDDSYVLTSVNNNSISSIVLGDASDTLTLSANFESFITTGNGTYQINGDTYKGNNVTIKTSADDSGLYAGTVSLVANDYVADCNTTPNNVTGLSGTITAQATDGTITTIGNLNSGETFRINDNYYKV
ncbi:MAG: hypothetical protein IJP68_02665, partial [Selenomonadaceae bacterium]|nr:hypothetical protein [Selenomonadaceae bacterium]